jgi:hypothetical protein
MRPTAQPRKRESILVARQVLSDHGLQIGHDAVLDRLTVCLRMPVAVAVGVGSSSSVRIGFAVAHASPNPLTCQLTFSPEVPPAGCNLFPLSSSEICRFGARAPMGVSSCAHRS